MGETTMTDPKTLEERAKEWVRKWAPTESSWVDYDLSYKAYEAGALSERSRLVAEIRERAAVDRDLCVHLERIERILNNLESA